MKRKNSTLLMMLAFSVGIQLLILLIFQTGHVGFDHVGKYDFTYNQGIGLIVIFIIAFLVSLLFIITFIYRKWFS